MAREHLTPFARRVVALHDDGRELAEIAEAFRRSPEHIARVISWAEIPRRGRPERRFPRALERRVLSMRSAGHTYDDIAGRFRASPGFIRRVEGLAHYRRALWLLRADGTS